MSDHDDRCPYCMGTYPHQGPTGCKVIMLTTSIALQQLNAICLYEMVMLCRDPGHVLWGNCQQQLAELALVDGDGHVHDEIRAAVLDLVVGDGLEMRLR